MAMFSGERTPGSKFMLAILIGLLLAIPIFVVWLLVYDRQSQSEVARSSIAEGWGGPQIVAGPLLVIPYLADNSETVTEGGKSVTRTSRVWRSLVLAPDQAALTTTIRPERRKRSIYEVVVYEAEHGGQARFSLPADLARFGVTLPDLALDRAELRFGLSDARGLFGAPPRVTVGGHRLGLQPGGGTAATGNSGFFSWLDARGLATAPITVAFDYRFRGNGWLSLQPQAGDTRWQVASSWPHPSFTGGFLPLSPGVSTRGFTASYRIGNLALGRALVETGDPQAANAPDRSATALLQPPGDYEARVDLVQPVDLYAKVSRAAKYGFLFIGFTFVALLLFDVIAGVRVSAVEYLLVGAALVLFFVLLLAFAEVIGFALAYLIAAAAIVGLVTAYSAAVLRSWHRASAIFGLLAALYVVLYVLLSLEAFALLIGSLLLFAALAGVMYLTRGLDWGGRGSGAAVDPLA